MCEFPNTIPVLTLISPITISNTKLDSIGQARLLALSQ